MRIGSASPPSNVTAGDLTALRAHFGTDAAFTSDFDVELNAGRMRIGGAEGAAVLLIESTVTSALVNNALVQISGTLAGSGAGMQALALLPTITPSASVSEAYSHLSQPTFNPGSGVTITTGRGIYAFLVTGSGAGALTNLYGVVVEPSYGTIKPTNADGIRVENMGSAGITTAVGLKVVTPTGATNNYSAIFTGSTPRVGIGTASPAQALHVVGRIKVNTGVGGVGLEIQDGQNIVLAGGQVTIQSPDLSANFIQNAHGNIATTGTPDGVPFEITTSNVVRISISSTGVVRFNAYGAGALSTDANGVIAASDARMKKDIRPFTGGLAALKRLLPVRFRWTHAMDKPDDNGQLPDRDLTGEYVGFTAQNVREALPEAVKSGRKDANGNDSPLNYDDRAIIALLVNAVVELDARLAAIETR